MKRRKKGKGCVYESGLRGNDPFLPFRPSPSVLLRQRKAEVAKKRDVYWRGSNEHESKQKGERRERRVQKNVKKPEKSKLEKVPRRRRKKAIKNSRYK
jgi:hypothetical protein